jgi:hypothetical protein
VSFPQLPSSHKETEGLSGAGPHDVGSDYAVPAGYRGTIDADLIVVDANTIEVLYRAHFDATIVSEATLGGEVVTKKYADAAWDAVVTSDPASLVIDDGEVRALFTGVAGYDLIVTLFVDGRAT